MQDKQREGQGTHCMVVALAKRLFLEPSLISQRNFLWSRRCSEAAFLAHLLCQMGWIGCPIRQERAGGRLERARGRLERQRIRPLKALQVTRCWALWSARFCCGSAQWCFLPEKSPNRNIGKIKNYVIIIITLCLEVGAFKIWRGFQCRLCLITF